MGVLRQSDSLLYQLSNKYYNEYMYKANIIDLKNNLKHFLELATAGNKITIMRRNVPIAEISPVARRGGNKTRLGSGVGSVQILGDLTAPLIPGSDWEMLE